MGKILELANCFKIEVIFSVVNGQKLNKKCTHLVTLPVKFTLEPTRSSWDPKSFSVFAPE